MWLDLIDDPLEPRAALPGPLDVDVAIVGGGFTGLWTAYYLAKADPSLRIVVLEKDIVGFGASGRNGGWVSPFFPASLETIEKHHGREQAVAMQRAMFDTVDEIGAVCAAEGIDARYHKGGVLNLATGTEQVERVREEPAYYHGWGVGKDEIMWLDGEAVRKRIKVAGCLGAMYLEHCACLDPAPARLVPLGRLRQGARLRLGRRLRRRRRRGLAYGRPHARRPDHRPRERDDLAAVGQPPVAQVGTRTPALDRRAHLAGGARQRRQEGEEDRQAGAARQAHEEGAADLNVRGGVAGGTLRARSHEAHSQHRRGE
jgi:hypothetical protein